MSPREQLQHLIANMNEQEVETLLTRLSLERYVAVMNSNELAPDYDPDNDPAIGFFFR